MLRVLHQAARRAVVALIPRCYLASETRNRDNKIRSRKSRRKQKLHEVRAAGLRVDPRFLTPLRAEFIREVWGPSHGERFLARLLQVSRNGVKEELSHLYLAGGRSATLVRLFVLLCLDMGYILYLNRISFVRASWETFRRRVFDA